MTMKSVYGEDDAFLHPDELSDVRRARQSLKLGSQTAATKTGLVAWLEHAYAVVIGLRKENKRLRECLEMIPTHLEAGRGKNYQEITAAVRSELQR